MAGYTLIKGSSDDLFKILLRMFADGTDKIVGHVLAHIFVAAYGASPDGLSLGCGANCLGLGLDVALIKLVGAGLILGKDRHEYRLTDEQSV